MGRADRHPHPIVGMSHGLERQVQDPFLQLASPGNRSLDLWPLSCYSFKFACQCSVSPWWAHRGPRVLPMLGSSKKDQEQSHVYLLNACCIRLKTGPQDVHVLIHRTCTYVTLRG